MKPKTKLPKQIQSKPKKLQSPCGRKFCWCLFCPDVDGLVHRQHLIAAKVRIEERKACVDLAEVHQRLFDEQDFPDDIDANSYRRGGEHALELLAYAIRTRGEK